MVKRFRQLESEFEGLDPGLLDEVIGYDDAEDPDLPFDSSAFAGAPSSVRRPPSPPPGGGALAGTLPAPSRTRFASFGGDEPVMSFDLEDEPQPDAEPVMSFNLDETEQAEPVMAFGLDESEAEPRMFSANEVFADDAVPPSPLFTADEVFGGPSPFADDVAEAAAVPGASRPVLSPTAEDQDETDGDPIASAAQAQRGPRPRTMGVDDAFDPMAQTQAERAAIARGERQDRRRRIAGGVLSGLGMLMAAGGGRGSGLGAALAASGGMIGRSANREDRARADMQARLASERERMAQDRQMARDEADAERQAAELELRRALTGSQIDQNRARVRSMDAAAMDAEAQRLAAAGDAAGLRDLIRARIEAMPEGPTRTAWLRRTAPGSSFDSINSVDILKASMAEIGDTDVRRGGQGPGGSGGGRGALVYDAATGQYTRARTPAARSPMAAFAEEQGASPSEVAATEAAYGDTPIAASAAAADAAPPRRARGRAPAAAASAAAGAPGAAPVVVSGVNAFAARARSILARAGVPESERQAELDRLVSMYDENERRGDAALAQFEQRAHDRELRDQQGPPESIRRRWAEDVATNQLASARAAQMVRFLENNADDIRRAMLVPALMRGPRENRLASLITMNLSETIKSFAGAAVSAQEMERILNAMQANPWTVLSDPAGVINPIRDAGRRAREAAIAHASTFSGEERAWFGAQARAMDEANAARRGSR